MLSEPTPHPVINRPVSSSYDSMKKNGNKKRTCKDGRRVEGSVLNDHADTENEDGYGVDVLSSQTQHRASQESHREQWSTFETAYPQGNQCRGHQTRHRAPRPTQANPSYQYLSQHLPSAGRNYTCCQVIRHQALTIAAMIVKYILENTRENTLFDKDVRMLTRGT